MLLATEGVVVLPAADAAGRHPQLEAAAVADAIRLVLWARLLDSLWTLLRPGGRLLYATCSVLKDENARQVQAFLTRTAGARALPLEARFGRASGPGRLRLPGELGMDGFDYALVGRDA